MILLKRIIFLFFAAPCFATSFTFGELFDVYTDAQFLDLVLENQEFCVHSIDGDKVYFKSENILNTEWGVFLLYDVMTLVRLPKTYSDQKGCYIKLLD